MASFETSSLSIFHVVIAIKLAPPLTHLTKSSVREAYI